MASLWNRRWLVIPVIFVVWSIAVVVVVRGLSDRIPSLGKVGLGMSFDAVKVLISEIKHKAEEDYYHLMALLAFLFL